MSARGLSSFEHEGLVFDVLDHGPRDGPVVLLLHGFPQRASSWDSVGPLLAAQGFRVVAPDQRGYSRRARPHGRSAYAMSHLTGDVVALIGSLGAGPVHLVGHDWGAAVGWALAATHPGLLRSFTAVSVPHPQAMVRSLFKSRQWRKSWYVAAVQVPFVPELVAKHAPGWVEGNLRRSGMGEAALERFRSEIMADGAFSPALGWYRAIPIGGPRNSARGSRKISVPTTLVWSDGDVAIDRDPVARCAAFVTADYRLVVLEGVDHWIPEHASKRLVDIIMERARSVQ